MKKHKSKKALLSIFLFLLIFNGIFIFGNSAFAKSITITFPFKLPWMENNAITFDGSTKPIAELVVGIYNWAIGVVGILAAVAMMLGGLMWVMAGGSAEKVGTAKSMITGALTGLILTLTSFMVLNSINPDLTRFRNIKISNIKKLSNADLGICITGGLSVDSFNCQENFTEEQCRKTAPGSVWKQKNKCPKPCCTWNLDHIATATCHATGCGAGNLYENCNDQGDFPTKADCKNKAGTLTMSRFLLPGKCKKYSLFNNGTTLVSYECARITD